MLNLDKSWDPIKELLNERFRNLPNTQYLPEKKDIFNVFKMPISKIKVVILGQDPYPTEGYAMGYAFAVPKGKEIPKSLNEIKKVINNNEDPKWQTLEHWIKSGVFLLNTALTVEIDNAGSHLKFWKNFTKEVIKYISIEHPCIWMLWGVKAKKFKKYICEPKEVSSEKDIEGISIKDKKNYILEAPHPARGNGFRKYGHKNFFYANKILGKEKIKW